MHPYDLLPLKMIALFNFRLFDCWAHYISENTEYLTVNFDIHILLSDTLRSEMTVKLGGWAWVFRQ